MSISSTIVDRHAAERRLRTLPPESLEHTCLSNALRKTIGIAEISLPAGSYRVETTSCKLLGGFGSSEHVAIGDKIRLQGLPDNTPLLVKGRSEVFFKHIVALAGDFYGIVDRAISLSHEDNKKERFKDAKERFKDAKERFKDAFESLANGEEAQLFALLSIIQKECKMMSEHSLTHHCYSTQLMDINAEVKAIKPDTAELLIDNSDHFSDNAVEAYLVGHRYALETAREANKTNDVEGLKRAYAIDAYACHFLTDLFSSGHVRNQRGALELFLHNKWSVPLFIAKRLAGVLTGAQHEKDGAEGLFVHNETGAVWKAYGDGWFSSEKNAKNKKKAEEAVQASVDEVYAAFTDDGKKTIPVTHLIPRACAYNAPPIYTVDNDGIYLLGKKVTSLGAFLKDAILTEAVRYLPSDYILSFLNPVIELPPIVTNVIVPQVELITGNVWHLIGVATYYQAKQGFQRVESQLDELGDITSATYRKTVEILDKLKSMEIKIDMLVHAHQFAKIDGPIKKIREMQNMHRQFLGTLKPSQIEAAESTLFKAYNALSTALKEEDHDFFTAYEAHLKASHPYITEAELKLARTRWFRGLLDYQVEAFCIYLEMNVVSLKKDEVVKQIEPFSADIREQIERNKNYIDEQLIYKRTSYLSIRQQRYQILQKI